MSADAAESSDDMHGINQRRAVEKLGYVTKGATGGLDGYFDHLLLNGGAGAHWSRGYFGRPIAEVVQAICEERYGRSEGNWVKVPRSD